MKFGFDILSPLLRILPPLVDFSRKKKQKKKRNSTNFSRFQKKKKFPTRDHKVFPRFDLKKRVQHVQHLYLPQRTFITTNSSSNGRKIPRSGEGEKL